MSQHRQDQARKANPTAARMLVALCAVVAAALAICAPAALAAETHPYTGVSFGPDGVGGSESFQGLRSVAVQASTGTVYAYDAGAGKIYKFDSSGNPVDFSALSSPVIAGLNPGFGGSEYEIAVAPPGSPGGTAGDIYVATNSGNLEVYREDGTHAGTLEVGGEVCGVATDPAGHLYTGAFGETIKEFTPSANPPALSDLTATGTAPIGLCNIAVDGLGNVYAANYGGGGLYQLSGLADTTPTKIDQSASTMAVAPGSNDLYAHRGTEIAQYDSSGTLIGTFGEGELSLSRGVAVNTGATKIYVGTSSKIKVFGPAATVPNTTTEAATDISKAAVTLHGTIDAAGGPEATCVFQYVTESHYSSEGFSGAAETPCSPAGPFTGSSSTAVTGTATGLATETVYYFRLLGSNENGSIGGAALTFTTPGAVNLETKPASNRTDSGARLNGSINPEGTELEECFFEYGRTGAYGSTVPCAESNGEIGSGNAPVTVHADVTDLASGAEYHFRLVGGNEFGTSQGADETFMTLGPGLDSLSVTGVGLTGAIFKAEVNPDGEATTYSFEYVSEADFNASGFANAIELPAGGESIGAGTTPVAVEQEATGLAPRTTYHLRIVAHNPSGSLISSDLVFTTYSESASGLPDGRAYEQATPVDKDGGNAQGEFNEVRTSPAGNGISFFVNGGLPGAEGGQNLSTFLALRGSDGWTTQGLLPAARYGRQAKVLGLSEDLSVDYTSAAVSGIENSTLEIATADRQYTTIYTVENNRYEAASAYRGSSADNEQALFEVSEALTQNDAQFGFPNLYLWDRTTQQFVPAGVMNDGSTPSEGVQAGPWDWFNGGGGGSNYYTQQQHVISADGSKVFFTDLATRQLYMRVNPTQPQSAMSGEDCTEAAKACTYRVSESQRSTADPNGPQSAQFLGSTADGSKVFFTSSEELTDDANTGAADDSYDLYSYDTDSHTLTDLTASTPAANPNGANVGGLLGMSDDGSYLYFVAGGILAPGATRGDCPHVNKETGSCNVYRWHAGDAQPITFLAHEEGETPDAGVWLTGNYAPADSGTGSPHTSRVTPDGRTLLLSSGTNLTAFDSKGSVEIYRFRVGDTEPLCISCLPSGESPRGSATLRSITTGIASRTFNGYTARNVSADGLRVFFETSDKLLAADVNGVKDVYEWEAEGKGSCAADDQNGGCLYLISTGTSPLPSSYADSSESGDDVYLFTAQPLVGQDRDELVDVYDARVGGGLASQYPPPPSICKGEACLPGATPPPASQSPGTSSFSGPGNPAPRKHHKKKHHKRHHHKKKHHKKKHHKKHHRKSQNRQQGSNR